MDYRRYRVSARDKAPLIAFVSSSLDACKCRVIRMSPPDEAPFRVTFETPDGERMGILAYAFLANNRITKNRPRDEHRFQVKYGSKTSELHPLWQDPFELYTTLFFGINPDRGLFVGADPILHSPTRFFISLEFKEENAEQVLEQGWVGWERTKRSHGVDEPIEILVGGTPEHFLRYVRFERAAKGLCAGHRALLADKIGALALPMAGIDAVPEQEPPLEKIHALSAELELGESEILDLIQSAPRLKMAVRGWVAEEHLERQLRTMPDVTECVRMEEDGRPDLRVRLRGERPLLIECRNVLRKRRSDGTVRVDFQRTRASKADPCTRFYRAEEFDVVAACLHPCTEAWEFRFATTDTLDAHKSCVGRLSNLVQIDERWTASALTAFRHVLDK